MTVTNIGVARAQAAELYKAAPATMKAFQDLMRSASRDGALSAKLKELMAVAIAVHNRCEDCIAYHAESALKHGSTREEFVEAIGVAIEMGGGPATVYGGKALALFDALQKAEG